MKQTVESDVKGMTSYDIIEAANHVMFMSNDWPISEACDMLGTHEIYRQSVTHEISRFYAKDSKGVWWLIMGLSNKMVH